MLNTRAFGATVDSTLQPFDTLASRTAPGAKAGTSASGHERAQICHI